MLDINHPIIPWKAQCDLLSLPRSSGYYQEKETTAADEQLMKLIDRHYTEYPHEGKIKRSLWLTEQVSYTVGVRKVRTLMNKIGLETIYPKPDTSVPNKAYKIYPYLLRDLCIYYPNQVWATDITYLPLHHSHVYLFAIMDLNSRYVVAWCISPTLHADAYVDTLIVALSRCKCGILNTDQGAQFTSEAWIRVLTDEKISISMDGVGAYLDNIFLERLWRSVKQECVYLYEFKSIDEIRLAIDKYFDYYNNQRMHQSLDYQTPAKVYFQTQK